MVNESELVRQACKGDAHAFACLYEKIYKKMYAYALYTLNHEQDAEDVVSDTVIYAFEHMESLRIVESFNSWIFKILSVKCKNKIAEYCKKRKEDNIEEINVTAEDVQAENSIDVRTALSKLNEEERMIVSLHHIAGYKTREIAGILSMKESTVRSKDSRAIKKMALLLK